jgi:serine/threonine-protein kinase
LIGVRLGRYRVVEEIGAGSMGTVYLAEDAGGRRVAAKVVHPHLLPDEEFAERFRREGVMGRRIDHPNVVRTLEIGRVDEGGREIHYLLMEYVQGRDLRALLHDLGTFPEALLREIALQTAAGLEAIHAAGVIHRDLKPANVLLTEDNHIRIMDLGVARLQETSVTLTREGQFTGSVLYAAPEQFGAGEVGPRADLYSLGVVLYELATGANPFRSEDPAEVMRAHLTLEPLRLREAHPEITGLFSELVATLLAKQADERFASAGAVQAVLQEGERSAWWRAHEPELLRREARLPAIPVRRATKLRGREEELAILRDAWAGVLDGKGRAILLEGEAGIGKTRLVDAFLRSVATRDLHVLYGSYAPAGGRGGLADSLLSKFGSAGLEQALAPYLPLSPSLIPGLAAFLRHESPPPDAQPLVADALPTVCGHLLQGLAAERPTLWIVDDLHFAPEEGRRITVALARALASRRVLLLVTTRPGLPPAVIAELGRLQYFTHVRLARLSPEQVVDLLRDASRNEAFAQMVGPRIAEKSDGIPFFALEFLHGLEERGLLDGAATAYPALEVPSAVRELIDTRLRDLSGREREVLNLAAAQGFEFDADLIARVEGVKRIQVLKGLAGLDRRAGLVRAAGRHYRFDHHQLQEILYAELTEAAREGYHTQLADALAAREGVALEAATGATALGLVHHHLRGRRPGKALPCLEAAFRHVEGAYRNDAALDLADRALRRPGLLDDRTRTTTLLHKIGRLNILGRRREERAALDEAWTLAEQTSDPWLRARTRLELGAHLWTQAEYEAAREQLEEVLALTPRVDSPDLASRAYLTIGLVFWNLARYDEARDHLERAIEIARASGDRRREGLATGNLGLVFSALGRYEEAQRYYERQRDLCRETGDRRGEALASGNLGNVCLYFGRYEDARAHYEHDLALTRDVGLRRAEGVAMENLGYLLSHLGQPEEAAELLERALALSHEIGDRRVEGYIRHRHGVVAERAGDRETARRWYEEAHDLRREIDYRRGVADTLTALGRLARTGGDDAAAMAHLDRASALAGELDLPGVRVVAAAHRACLPGGDAAAARTAFAEHEWRVPWEERVEFRFTMWQATGDRAELAEAHRLLEHLRDHAPAACRETMIRHVPLHRDIVTAWREHRWDPPAPG